MPYPPTPPVAVPIGPNRARGRLAAGEVAVSDRCVAQLREVCADVRVDESDRMEHGRDWWPLTVSWAVHEDAWPSWPAVVVRPASVDEVSAIARTCNEHRVPLTPMGGRSGVCGASLPVHGGVALDTTGMHGIVSVDDASLLVSVRAGQFGDELESTLRSSHGLTLGHWPQSIALSTVGGWLACRSAGQYSTRYGKIEDLVVGLEVVLADGTVIHTGGRAPREASGPDLTQLFVGSEGTLGIITEALLRVRPVPPMVERAAYGFADFGTGLDACRRILRRGATPAVLRLYDADESARSYSTTPPTCLLLVLDEADEVVVHATMAIVDQECSPHAEVLDPGFVDQWLDHRNDVSQLEASVRRGFVVDTIEIAARWSALAGIHEAVIAAMKAVPGTIIASCHQSHAYADGACLYFTFAGLAADDPVARDAYYCTVWDAATHATRLHGGALSHHHGIGLNRARFLREALGPAFAVLASVKSVLDPRGILNPGKLGLDDPFGPVAWAEGGLPSESGNSMSDGASA